jgi:hypothetical protein
MTYDDWNDDYTLEPGDIDRYGNRYAQNEEYEAAQERLAEQSKLNQPQPSTVYLEGFGEVEVPF